MPPKKPTPELSPAATSEEEDAGSDTTEVVTVEDSPPPHPPPKQGPAPNPKPKKTSPQMATTALVGIPQPFDSSVDDYEIWKGTFQSFLEANGLDTTNDKKKCHGIFLSCIGIKNYSLLTTLSSPDPLSGKTLKELKALMKAHFKPDPMAIAERFKFTG